MHRRDRAQRGILDALADDSQTRLPEFDLEALTARLHPDVAAIGYWSYRRPTGEPAAEETPPSTTDEPKKDTDA